MASCWEIWWDDGFLHVFKPFTDLFAEAKTPFRDYEDLFIATVLWVIIGTLCHHVRESVLCPLVSPPLPMSSPTEVQDLFYAYFLAQVEDVRNRKGLWNTHSPHKSFFEEEDGLFIRLKHDLGSHKSPHFHVTGKEDKSDAKPDRTDKPSSDKTKSESGVKRNRHGEEVDKFGAPVRHTPGPAYKNGKPMDNAPNKPKGNGAGGGGGAAAPPPPPAAVRPRESLDVRKTQICPFHTMHKCGRASASGKVIVCLEPCSGDRKHVDPALGTRAECVTGLEAVDIQAKNNFIRFAKAMPKGFFKGE